LAAALAAAAVCYVVVAGLLAVDPVGRGRTVLSVVDRLRLVAGRAEAATLVALIAVVLVALDGITSGDRRGPSTPAGRSALYVSALVAAVVSLGLIARVADMLAGNVAINAPGPHARVMYRIANAGEFVPAIIFAVGALWLALQTLDDGDWWIPLTSGRGEDGWSPDLGAPHRADELDTPPGSGPSA
jgi:hypothetical protein